MATLAVTFSQNTQAGTQLRELAEAITRLADQLPDNPMGASTVLTIDNGPSTGTVGVQITAGPTTTSQIVV